MKRPVLIIAALTLFAGGALAETPQTGRTWLYGNFTTAFSPELSATLLGGYRMEFARSDDVDPKRVYLFELFAGPNVSRKIGPHLTLKGSLWYYYMGFPILTLDRYEYTHSIELIPAAEYKTGRWTFYDRVILHNTVYASIYPTARERNGWGLVVRELVQARYAATGSLSLQLADEPFFGVKEDADAPPNNGPGYWENGLRLNRLYAGVDIKLTSNASITPLYMLETVFGEKAKVTEQGHYAFVTFSYVLKLFEPPPPPSTPSAPLH